MKAFEDLRALGGRRPLQLAALVGLLAGLAWVCSNSTRSILDPDLWWHLKVGDWIVQHHSVPSSGIFSRVAAEHAWKAYSWGFEVLLSGAYSLLGLLGLGIFTVVLILSVAYSIYWMLFRLSRRFWLASVLAIAACTGALFNIAPRPVFVSIILFVVELTLILEASTTGNVKRLYWLPLIFVIWANLHIQFVYGLFLLALLLVLSAVCAILSRFDCLPSFVAAPKLPLKVLAGVFGACVLATGIGPYSFGLYKVVFEYSRATFTYGVIHELQPPDFRTYGHYFQLLLAAGAFFALGTRKKVDAYRFTLLFIASMVAFRTLRDSWFICIPAAACIAEALRADEEPEADGQTWLETLAIASALAVVLLMIVRNTEFNNKGFSATMDTIYPVRAVEFVRQTHLRSPLYNTLDWGGFLIWALPEYPVAVDARNDLYGDELDRRFYETQMGYPSYVDDPYLNEAGCVLIQREAPLAALLASDPRFVLIYRDRLAAVFAHR